MKTIKQINLSGFAYFKCIPVPHFVIKRAFTWHCLVLLYLIQIEATYVHALLNYLVNTI
jgi:hypothetical protein